MNRYLNRYASAVRSKNLVSSPRTRQSDSDVLGAAGLAAKRHALAVAVMRLMVGDDRNATEIVSILADDAFDRVLREGLSMKRTHVTLVAQAVLAWHRHGRCDKCGGHGFDLIGPGDGSGRSVLSDRKCKSCHGTGKILFDRQFRKLEHLLVARWMREWLDEVQADAMNAAAAKLAPKLNLEV